MDDRQAMQRAIEAARRGIAAGQTPFGAVIVRAGRVVADAHNGVWAETDPTAHGEVQAIRAACRALGTIDLSDCTIYSTCEPCPMCFTAIHWAKIPRLVYGATIADAESAGFAELTISNEDMARQGGSRMEIVPHVRQAECAALFDEWKSAGQARVY